MELERHLTGTITSPQQAPQCSREVVLHQDGPRRRNDRGRSLVPTHGQLDVTQANANPGAEHCGICAHWRGCLGILRANVSDVVRLVEIDIGEALHLRRRGSPSIPCRSIASIHAGSKFAGSRTRLYRTCVRDDDLWDSIAPRQKLSSRVAVFQTPARARSPFQRRHI